jgi:pimeloyl-ACP methyl ester carboxylesterase
MPANEEHVSPYSARRPSRCEFLSIRGVQYNVRWWGQRDAPPILFLHGGQDSSITFQFLIDALQQDWAIIAPDFQGHGWSDWNSQGYWLHEILADLDGFFSKIANDQPMAVVGHSMGGNVASLYAGLRPDRVTRLVSLDAFGPRPDQIPASMNTVLSRYLDRLRCPREPHVYPSIAAMARRLQQANPRLSPDKAMFLAEHSSSRLEDGNYRWLVDPNYQGLIPSLHGVNEWRDFWSRIQAPVLWIVCDDHRDGVAGGHAEILAARRNMIPSLAFEQVPDTGHNLHHDRPEKVAQLIEQFLS